MSSISPSTVSAGSAQLTVTVAGTGFTSTTTIQIGGVSEPTAFVSNTQVTATVAASQLAAGGTLGIVAVSGSSSSSSGTAVSLVVNNPAPAISQVSPAVIPFGSTAATVSLTGTGFVPSTAVQINGSARTTVYVSSTQVNVVLSAADLATTGTLSLVATNPAPAGGTSPAASLAINNPAPGAIGLSPSVVIAGGTPAAISVTGSSFLPSSTVQVGGAARATTYVSATQLTFQLVAADQATAGSLSVTVVNPGPGGGASTPVTLSVSPATPTPVISAVSPASFIVGSPITSISVQGSNFTSNSIVQWNGTNLSTSLTSYTIGAYTFTYLTAKVTADLLASLGTATITVSSPTSNPSLSNSKTVSITNPPVPTLTTISPGGAPFGTATMITLAGTGFTSASTVQMDGQTLTSTFVSAVSLTAQVPASIIALPGTHSVSVTTPAPGGGTSAALGFTAYIAIANNAMALNPANGLLYISVPGSAGAPYGNSVVSVDPATGALGTPIYVGSEPDKLAISSDGTTLWVGLDGASAVRKVDLISGTAGMQFSLGDNSGTYAFPPVVHAITVLPGTTNSIAVSSAYNPDLYDDKLVIYDSGVARTNQVNLSTLESLPAIFASSTKPEIYATSDESGYQVLSYNSAGLQNAAGNTGTSNFNAPSGTELQVDNGTAYLDSGVALNAETGALLGTFYSSGTTVGEGPIASDSSLGKLFVLENATASSTAQTQLVVQAFNESNFTAITSGTVPVSGAVSGTKFSSNYSTETELDGYNSIDTLVRWGPNGLAFRAANGVFSFRSNLVRDLSTTNADLGVTLVPGGSTSTGATTTYTATISNAGPAASTGVALSASIPSTGTLMSAVPSAGTCTTAAKVTCDLGSLASGASVSVIFTIQQMTAGSSSLSIQVVGSENDPNSSNNQASSTVTISGNTYSPVPSVSSLSPSAILTGSGATTLTVTGAGFNSASAITVGGVALPTTLLSSTQVSALVPASALAALGWTTVSVSTPAPGGGTSPALPLFVYSVVPIEANHILFDPFSQKIMASIGSNATATTGNSLVAITPQTGSVSTPVPIGSQPENMALTSDGQILYVVLSGSQSVARFNMLTQQPDFTYTVPNNSSFDGGIALRGVATQPGTENTIALDIASFTGNAIYDFNPATKTAAIRGQASGPYTGSCIQFLDPGDLIAVDTDTSGATLDHYTVTAAGFTYYSYSQYTESTLNAFGCFKLSGGLAFANAGGVANPAISPASETGIFTGVTSGGTFSTSQAFAPDASLERAFFMANTTSTSVLDGIAAYDATTYLASGTLPLNMSTIEGNTSYTPIDMVRWGQDGLAVLTSGNHLYLLRGALVAPQELNVNSPAAITSSSATTIAQGSGNTLLTLTGSNFVPGVAILWNGSYRTTTIISPTQVTVAIPASDLTSAGTASLVAINPGGSASSSLTITIN